MAAKSDAVVLLFAVVAVMGFAIAATSSATISLDHIVGGRNGWSLPPNSTFFQEWAHDKTFVVGDKLVFMYSPGLFSIMQVSKEDFDACTEKKVLNWYYAGPTVLTLDKPGPYYFYCGVGVHCEHGQKLSINVSATPVPDPARDGLPTGTLAAASSAGNVAATLATLVFPVLLSLLM